MAGHAKDGTLLFAHHTHDHDDHGDGDEVETGALSCQPPIE